MQDLAKRILTLASTILVGLVLVSVGWILLSSQSFYYYSQVGFLLVPAGLFTIAVAVRWHLRDLLAGLTLPPTVRIFLLIALTVGFLSWGVFSLWYGSLYFSIGSLQWVVGLMLASASLAVLLKTLARARHPPTGLESEKLRMELDRAFSRPLGVSIIAGLTACDGVSTVVIAVLFILFVIGTKTSFFLTPIGLITLVVWPFYGLLKTWVAFGIANGSKTTWQAAIIQNTVFLVLMLVSILVWPFLIFYLVSPLAFLLQNYLLIAAISAGFSIFTIIYLSTPSAEKFFQMGLDQGRLMLPRSDR